MITLVTGFPGSGKSYYAVHKIYNVLVGKDKELNNIDVIYSNIGGLKFNSFPDSKVKIIRFDSENFYIYLNKLFLLPIP